MLVTEQRHVREHEQSINRRRRGLGRQHVLVPDAHERLLRERRAQIRRDALDDAPRGAAKSRIAFVAGLRERGRGRLAKNGARAARHVFVGRVFPAELEQKIGIVVFGEKSEQHAARVGKWRRVFVPPVLEQASNGVDRSDAFEVLGAGGRNA